MRTRYKCGICDKRWCLFVGKKWSADCITAYHNDIFFGLSRSDSVMHGNLVKDLCAPNDKKGKSNTRRATSLKENIDEDD